jgi:RimJ/RimL family protein N-acetyltransferase
MWKPIDREFFAQRTPVEIADCGGVGALGRLVRDLIEELGGTAHLHLCGTPGDFLKVISQGEAAAPYIVVLAHGDDNGLVFGQFADPIDTSMLVDGSMPPECIAEHIDLPGRVVFNDACGAGEAPMAQAFLKGGLKGYIGSVEPVPHGTAGIMFIAHFFHRLWRTGCSEREAWEQAAGYDADSRLYAYWDEHGGHLLRYAEVACTAERFSPRPADGMRWWRADEWEEFRRAHEGRWSNAPFWDGETWRRLYAEGYRYCSRLVDGRAVAIAGIWPRTDREWEVIGLTTAEGFRRKGYGRAIVSCVTQRILDAGRVATMSYKEENAAMRRLAEALGYRPR